MQDQLTSGNSNLQQSGSNLQQSSSSLQQSGSPAVSPDVFTVLSQNAQQSGLQVESAQTSTEQASQTFTPSTNSMDWLLPLLLLVVVISVLVNTRRPKKTESVAPVSESVSPKFETATAQAKKPATSKKAKTGKKTTRRKRQASR